MQGGMNVMDPAKIARINELARKSRQAPGLNEQDKAEQAQLRAEYLASFRRNLEEQLNSITIQEPDGTRHKLTPADDADHTSA